jgi:acyl-homoserine lactone acylase PvdQ
MRKLLILLFLPLKLWAQDEIISEEDRMEAVKISSRVTIIRDNWGIPHIYGKKDADVVFGLMYAQCEDNFRAVELNYIKMLGRLSEVNGPSEIYQDLKMRLLIDSSEAIADYKSCSPYMKELLDAFAMGINYYLFKNEGIVTPLLINHFEPWFPLLWTNGSIDHINSGGIGIKQIAEFYSDKKFSAYVPATEPTLEHTGSNGFAISPSITENKAALLYINPHVSLHYRTEAHMVSEEGLNAYGAVTWGQFFVYQGFNDHCGWMHTSSKADAADLYLEKVAKAYDDWIYLYEGKQKKFRKKDIVISYLDGDQQKSHQFVGYFSDHGPVLSKKADKWVAVRAMNRSKEGLLQSWERIKAKNLTEFRKTLNYLANGTDNTTYADAEGNIAYWHGNYIPVRNTKFDWSLPVDGSVAETEWKGLHKTDQLISVLNPSVGYIQNCNSSPFSVSGLQSPKRDSFPSYMAPEGENFRSLNAKRLLEAFSKKKLNLDRLINIGYDKTLSAFEVLIPALIQAYEVMADEVDSCRFYLEEPISMLKSWDYSVSESSIETALAVEWGNKIEPLINDYKDADQVKQINRFVTEYKQTELLRSMMDVIKSLNKRFYRWQVEWGEINRFQRTGYDNPSFQDANISYPIAFASATWGMLPSYSSNYFPGTDLRYGTHGNSFVCAVEFGKKIKAKALLDGGVSGDSNNKHFEDQAALYTKGKFRDVLFYKEDVSLMAEKTYHPGE